MSDLPPTPDLAALVEELRAQVGGLRSANARLREVVTSKDELSAGKNTLIEAQREQLGNYVETVRLHADRAQVQDQLVDAQEELIDRLTAENAELRRRLSMDSSNSSLP
ncbi:MAG TPA: hypothetical protein VF317_08575, partial [Dermatophilaceae bacterium]